MPALKYEDHDGTFKTLTYAAKGEKGDKGDPGQDGADGQDGTDGAQGPPGGMGPLDSLQDVTAPASTPSGKVLGTTGVGAWAPIDPPATGLTQPVADTLYVNLIGDVMSGQLTINNRLTVNGIVEVLGAGSSVIAPYVDSKGGVNATGKVTNVTTPTAGTDAANRNYVDSRIWTGTQAQYDAVSPKDAAVLYVIVP